MQVQGPRDVNIRVQRKNELCSETAKRTGPIAMAENLAENRKDFNDSCVPEASTKTINGQHLTPQAL